MEYDLQVKINEDLRQLKWGAWHREKGRGRNYTHNKWKFDSKDKEEATKTWPDLLIQPGWGYLFYVEVKDKGKKETKEQVAFREWAIGMKYHYYVVSAWPEWELVKRIEQAIIELRSK